MNKAELQGAKWRKATRSNGSGACVEVAPINNTVAVRDSKDPDGPAFVFNQEQWTHFINGIRS